MGRFINGDAFASTGQGILSNNMFAYCNNNPVNMIDTNGYWAEWFESIVKVASAAVVVIAVVATTSAVTAFTAGTGTAAAVYGWSIVLGASLSGINGGVANEAKGNSYFNGYVGGATGGAIQSSLSKKTVGVWLGGGLGVTVGTAITDGLNNIDPYSSNSTVQEMSENAFSSGGKALMTSALTAFMGHASEVAIPDGCGGLMPTYTYGFGEAVKTFFGWLDDAMVYLME